MKDLIARLEDLNVHGWKIEEVDGLQDIIIRLKRSQLVCDRLMTFTREYDQPLPQIEEVDEWHDRITVMGRSFVRKRSKPGIPIALRQLSTKTHTAALDDETARLIFEHDLEGYYQNAWLIRKRFRSVIPGARKFDCPEIRHVRNLLIEHRTGPLEHFQQSYSFGTDGPQVQSLMPSSSSLDRDRGLIHNHSAFTAAIEGWLGKIS